MVTLIANVIPFQKPDGGPNFYPFDPNVVYEIHVDNNGDAVEDITFQWQFTTEVANPATFLYNTGPVTSIADPDLNVRQFYSLTRIDGPRRTGRRTLLSGRLPVPPPNIGPRSTPNYGAFAGGVQQLPPTGMRAFAGQRDEGFYVDLAVFDLLGVGSGEVEDSTAGFNVSTLALQVPIRDLTMTGGLPAGPSDRTASSASGRPPAAGPSRRARPARSTTPATSSRSRASAIRSSTKRSSISHARTCSTRSRRPRTPQRSTACSIPRCPSCST